MSEAQQPRTAACRLTLVAQEAVAAVLDEGGLAIDATMGNGHDTEFLARRVGPTGQVLALDIQAAALAATRQRLHETGLLERAQLQLAPHQDLLQLVDEGWRGQVDAAMFNLGYLPGSDKRIVTRASDTARALQVLPDLMRQGGRVSVLVYRGHAGGSEEFALLDELASTSAHWRLLLRSDQGRATQTHHPVLFVLEPRLEKEKPKASGEGG